MKKIAALLALCCFVFVAGGQTVYREYVDGQVYVKFNPGILKSIAKENPRDIPVSKFSPLEKLVSAFGIKHLSIPFYQASDDAVLTSILKVDFTSKGLVEDFIRALTKIGGVEYAEKVRLNKTDAVPNDPLFATGTGSTHLNQINAQSAWNIFNSSSNGSSTVALAIVDNAVMRTHADLNANIYVNAAEANGSTGVDDDGNGYIDDINGYDVADWDANTIPTNTLQSHGTHCAGIAGAVTDNTLGVASIGWNIKIVPVKAAFDASSITAVDVGYPGIIYAVKSKAKIISCSWGNSGSPSLTEQSVIDYAWNRGCLIFASAGNLSSSSPNYPGAYNHVFCVAAVDANNVKSSYSNYGTWVDICAPGDNIMSTVPYATSASPAYLSYSGTSMATPLVAGLAALMKSKSPNMTRQDILNCLSNTAVNVYSLSGNSSYVTGNQLGVGRIDAYAAMICASTYSALPPVANFYAFLPNTCPNTLIPFIDSSLYVPTSWNWTFQGGTPSTSTLSNPSVQWSTPGTYSVSLTVSNTNGNNTKTKLSYITVAGPSSLPFFEGFQSGSFLPSGWVANNIWNDGIYWEQNNTVGGFGTSTSCAVFNNFDYNAPGERDEMRSPKFDFSNVVSSCLRFDVAYARYDATFSDSLEVKLSTDCGTTWTSIYLKGGTGLATSADQSTKFVPTSTKWRRDTIDISLLAAGHNNVMFSFLNHGAYGQPIYLDNINLVFPTPTLSTNHATVLCTGSSLTFTNTSLGSASYTWNFQGGSPASSTATNPTVSYATPGTYTLSLFGINGTSTVALTKTVTVTAPPNLSITSSASGSICAGAAVNLIASGASTYSWSTGASSSSITVSPSTSTVYSVIGFNPGCSGQSSIAVAVGSGSVSVAIVSSTSAICSGQSVVLNASGASSYTWNTSGPTGTSITVSPSITTQYTLSGASGACIGSAFLTVTVTPIPTSTITTANSSGCNDLCNGMVQVTSSGGGPFTYSLNQGACPSLPCSNLCEGLYTLTTFNAGGCSSSTLFSIAGPQPFQAVVSATNPSCGSCNDGILSVNALGGSGPFTYTWLPTGGNNASALGLAPGCYTVNVTNAMHCVTSTTMCLDVSTGLARQAESRLKIYPNPAQRFVTIEFLNHNFDVLISNHLGQIVFEKTNLTNTAGLDLEGLSSGIYYIQIFSNGEIFRQKQVIH